MRSTHHPPSICHVLHTLNVGGAELLARDFAERNRDSVRVVFACLDEAGSMAPELREKGFRVEVFERQPGFDARCVRRLARFFREQNVRLVHAHQYAPFFYASLSRLVGPKFPIIFTEHGRDYPDFRRWKRVWANKCLLRKGDRAVGVGNHVRQALIDYEGIDPQRVDVIYNGVNVRAYDVTRPLRDQVRRELGLGTDEHVIIQVARLNRLKDHATALRAMHALRPQERPARLLLVGDGEERQTLERLVDELHLRESVRLLGLRQDVPRLLQAADVFLLSSISEGIPLTLIEAMLTGLPCVATRVGGIPEVVVDGQTGLLGQAGDGRSLAAALDELLESPERRLEMGTAGRERAVALFDDRTMHATYRRLYRQLSGLPLKTGVPEIGGEMNDIAIAPLDTPEEITGKC